MKTGGYRAIELVKMSIKELIANLASDTQESLAISRLTVISLLLQTIPTGVTFTPRALRFSGT